MVRPLEGDVQAALAYAEKMISQERVVEAGCVAHAQTPAQRSPVTADGSVRVFYSPGFKVSISSNASKSAVLKV